VGHALRTDCLTLALKDLLVCFRAAPGLLCHCLVNILL
jgi:hypothetical protein